MARLALHYIPIESFLHRWDTRCKLLGLVLITATLLYAEIDLLVFNSILLISLFYFIKIPIRKIFRDISSYIILLSLFFIFQIFFTSGERVMVWLPISKEGLTQGILTFWRLFLLISYSILFTATTRPRELRDAIIWFLKPIPSLPAKRIALATSLAMKFFSRILDQSDEVKNAYIARFGELNKNPFRKIKFLTLPILRRSILDVEELTYSLFSRGYGEDLPINLPKLPFIHLIPIFILFCLFIFFI